MKSKRLFNKIVAVVLILIIVLEIPFTAFARRVVVGEVPIELNTKAQNIAKEYENVRKIIYGKSVMDRDLEAYVIDGLGRNDRTIFCTFAVHGFEDYSYRDGQYLTQCANNLIEYLAQNPYILKDCRIVIIPCANPDGAIDGENNERACDTAFGRCTANHIDINRDFNDLKAIETNTLKCFMDHCDPYIFIDFHGWLDEVLGDGFLVDAFRTTNGLNGDMRGVYASTKGYAFGYAKKQLGSYSALVEFKNPSSLNYVDIAKGIAKSIEDLPYVYNHWGVNRFGWCYTDYNGYMVTNRWVEDSYDWCYVGDNGVMCVNDWITDYWGWCYVDDYGHLVRNSWVEHPLGWCYVDSQGHSLHDEWRYIDSSWYYFDSNGFMLTNRWQRDYCGWCYVDESGKMITDAWAKDYKSLCIVDSGGHLITDAWAEKDGNRHYMDSDGHLTVGWLEKDNNNYYFDKDGVMVKGVQIIDGVQYDFGTDGVAKKIENGAKIA